MQILSCPNTYLVEFSPLILQIDADSEYFRDDPRIFEGAAKATALQKKGHSFAGVAREDLNPLIHNIKAEPIGYYTRNFMIYVLVSRI
jgi:hypothetical protein